MQVLDVLFLVLGFALAVSVFELAVELRAPLSFAVVPAVATALLYQLVALVRRNLARRTTAAG